MKIPEVRAELLKIAEYLCTERHSPQTATRICELVEELKRRPYKRGRRSSPATWKVQGAVKTMRQNNPEMSNKEIATMFNISCGRITDIMRGVRP